LNESPEEFQYTILPIEAQEKLLLLDNQLKEDEITLKGYNKQRLIIWKEYVKKEEPCIEPCKDVSLTDVLLEPDVNQLPTHAALQLEVIKREYDNDELTLKGYTKRRCKVLEPYMLTEPKIEALPLAVQNEYKSLEKELEEGDITEKGFKKKRTYLLKPHLIPVHASSYPIKKKRVDIGKPVKPVIHVPERKQTRYSVVVFEDGNKLFKCDVCGEMFKQPQSFSGHYRSHRADLDKQFLCEMCDATFTTKSHLKIHMYKHTGDYPYSCEVCGKGFGAKSSARTHELRHSIKKESHQCSSCGALFLLKRQLMEHECEKETLQQLDLNSNMITEDGILGDEHVILTDEQLEIHLSMDDETCSSSDSQDALRATSRIIIATQDNEDEREAANIVIATENPEDQESISIVKSEETHHTIT